MREDNAGIEFVVSDNGICNVLKEELQNILKEGTVSIKCYKSVYNITLYVSPKHATEEVTIPAWGIFGYFGVTKKQTKHNSGTSLTLAQLQVLTNSIEITIIDSSKEDQIVTAIKNIKNLIGERKIRIFTDKIPKKGDCIG